MKTWNLTLWVVFALILCVCVYIANFVIHSYLKAGVLRRYLFLLASIIFYFTIASVVWRGDYELHLHHYTVGMVAVIMLGYQSE